MFLRKLYFNFLMYSSILLSMLFLPLELFQKDLSLRVTSKIGLRQLFIKSLIKICILNGEIPKSEEEFWIDGILTGKIKLGKDGKSV